jgi:hypothetical protein
MIFILGFGVLFYELWHIFRKRDAEWIFLVRKTQTKPILKGFSGFIILGLISIFIPLIIQFIIVSSEIAVYNVSLYFISLIISYGTIFVLFLWLGTRTRYESENNFN